MALSDLKVFSEFLYDTMTEVTRQKVELFNAASGGAFTLQSAANLGDYSERAFFAKVSGLVKRRNAAGSGAQTEKVLQQLLDTMVKIAAGLNTMRIDPGQFRWIQKDPALAGATIGQQLAGDMLADMLNTAIGCTYSAMNQVANIKYDGSGLTSPANLLTFASLNNGQAKFGDRSSDIVCWVVHSKPMHDLYGANLTNSGNLFTYGNVNVTRDPFGKLFVMTDCSNLFISGTPNKYATLGLVRGAVNVEQNNDFDANEDTVNGDENIKRTYQAEWTYNLGIKGFAWDKTNGGRSPNDAALFTATNWDRYATSDKDLPGVLVLTQ